jgi:antitoxin component of MazEF toxin-antitoxin module
MGLTEGSSLELSTKNGVILMRQANRRPRRPLKKLIAQMNRTAYRRHNRALLNDQPVGKEIW